MFSTLEKAIVQKRSLLKRFYSTTVKHSISNPQFDSSLKQQIYNEKKSSPQTHEDYLKSLRIAILGLPNVGKSTLINRLVRRPICAASSKVQTTRQKSDVLLTEEDTQLIFIDTPGIVTKRDVKKYELEPSFVSDVEKSVATADCVALVQDVSHYKAAKINQRVRVILERIKLGTTTILILNKVDKMKHKAELLDIITTIKNEEKSYPDFTDFFMISALNDDGVDDLRAYFLNLAQPKNWDYKSNDICGDPPEVIIQRAVRAKFMDNLPGEIPYNLKIELEHFSILPDDSTNVVIAVTSPSDRIASLVMGLKGKRLKKVALDAEQELCQAFRKAVKLKISVKFEDDGRNKLKRENSIKELMG